MPRIARIVAIEYPHHIIQRGNNKQSIFFDYKDRQFYLYLLKKYSGENYCKSHAYCLMDNHVHLLMVPLCDNSLAKTMQKLSLTYTQYFNKKYNRTGRLWECRFHSAIVDTDIYLLKVCKYIERNPVRAKLVNNPLDYEWSSARINGIGKKDDFVESVWPKYVEKAEYLEFIKFEDKIEDIGKIRKSTLTGRPLGGQEFINNLVAKFPLLMNTKGKGRPRKLKK